MAHFLHKIFGLIHKNGLATFGLLTGLSIGLSIIGFISMSDNKSFELWMIIQALVLSFADLPTDENGLIILAKVSWMVTFASAAFSLFLRDWSYNQFFKSIAEEEYTAIIGVGKLSYNYINKLDKDKTIILNNNLNIASDIFKENGFAIKDIVLDDVQKDINIYNLQKVLINTGTDRDNINIAFEIIKSHIDNSCSKSLRLIVRIENRELNNLFLGNKLFNDTSYGNSKIELKTYSFFEECASRLFQDNFIDGEESDIIRSDEEYSIAISGDGKLANKIIYEACKIAHLPNENILNIYLVCNDPEKFQETIIKSYPNIQKIPTVKLHLYKIDYNSLNYFTDNIWKSKNLTNVVVCYDDENINLEIVSSMQDKTYLREEKIQTKVLFGVFNQGSISQRLDQDDGSFNRFNSFGNANDILTVENVFDDKNNTLAKLVNYTYDGLMNDGKYNSKAIFNYKDNQTKVNKQWFKTNYTDKISSLAQAKHIKMKLKVLGLITIKSNKTTNELLTINRSIIDSKFDINFKGNYQFPNNFNKLFDQMIRLEHNRWNAYHYLNGWEYSSTKDKEKKKHDCLLPIADFPNYFTDKNRLEKLIEWDIYALMYIPNYLAEGGYEILPSHHQTI